MFNMYVSFINTNMAWCIGRSGDDPEIPTTELAYYSTNQTGELPGTSSKIVLWTARLLLVKV